MSQQSAAMRAFAPLRTLARATGKHLFRWLRIFMIAAMALGPTPAPPPPPVIRKIEARAEVVEEDDD